MGVRAWEKKRGELQPYRRRRPEATVLYSIAAAERDNLGWQWEALFQESLGLLRPVVTKTLDAFLDCGIPGQGGVRVVCSRCNSSEFVPFSCKKRGVCPSCGAKRALLFSEQLTSEVLAKVPHRHIVLGVPKRIRYLFRRNRKLLTILPVLAWKSIKELYGEISPHVPALALTVQSAGEFLNFNPHLHGILACGTFDAEGNFYTLPSLNTEKLARLFAHKVLRKLLNKDLLADSVVEQILSQGHSGFSAWLGEEICPDDEGFRLFLAGYIDRCPVSNSALTLLPDGKVKYSGKDGKFQFFDPLQFLALLTAHIPDHYESVVRLYGSYSYRSRGERKKKQRSENATQGVSPTVVPPTDSDKRKASKCWAALIKRVFEVDPLICRKCGGVMTVKSFITDPRDVVLLLENLKIPPYIQPLPIHSAIPPDGWSGVEVSQIA